MGSWKIPVETSRIWLARADQAHRIAGMLSPKDAAAVEAYAAECEAKAKQPSRPTQQPLAA
jgi:hypothetical protein